MMRVLLVNDEPPAAGSGAEVHLMRLSEGLSSAGDDVRTFAGEVRHRGAARALDLWDPLARRALRRVEATFQPDVVHVHNFARELSSSVLGAPRRAARVLTVHDLRLVGVPDGPAGAPFGPAPLRALKGAKARLDRAIARRQIDAVIAPTSALAAALAAAGIHSVHVVPNFADPGPEPARSPSACSEILYAGRLSPEKGVAELIEAFSRAAAGHPETILTIAGDGPDRARLESVAGRVAPGRVRFLGLLDEAGVRAAMARARAVALPSLAREVSPMVVVETALAGRPIVMSDIPGARDLIDEAGSGIVISPGNAEALSGALERLLAEPALADRMGASGRRVALATRSPAVAIARTRDIYREAIRAAARRAPLPVR